MPAGQTCGTCDTAGHNRRTCPDEIERLMTGVESSFAKVEGLLIERPRQAAQMLREHMTQLAGDRDEAQGRAAIAERELAGASAKLAEAELRISELEDANAAKDQTIRRLISFLNRMRARNDDIVERVRHLQAV